ERANEWQTRLDFELNRLNDKYRVAIVLCDLEGKTRKEAARQLGVPEGTLSARLDRARQTLARRLARHGLVVGNGSLAAVLLQNVAKAGVPAALMSSTSKAVSALIAGQTLMASGISANVANLTEGVLKAMLFTKLKTAATVFCAIGLIGTLGLYGGTLASEKQDPKQESKSASLADPKTKPEGSRNIEPRLAEVEKQLAQLLDEVKTLRSEIKGKAPSADKDDGEFKVFRLKYAKAETAMKMLREIYPNRFENGTMRLVADPRTNSLLV